MRIVVTVTCVVLLGIAIQLCSAEDKRQVVNSTSTALQEFDGSPPIPYDKMLLMVANLSKQTGVANLKDTKLRDGQTEIRIWIGFGLITPRCFMIAIRRGRASASFLTVRVRGNKAVYRNGDFVYINPPVKAPRSGWGSFLAYLKQHGIGTSIELALDKREIVDEDSEELVLEMKSGSRHAMAYYNVSTASVDGKKALEVCQQIRNEFDVNLGCP